MTLENKAMGEIAIGTLPVDGPLDLPLVAALQLRSSSSGTPNKRAQLRGSASSVVHFGTK